jgi:hypothetical protein
VLRVHCSSQHTRLARSRPKSSPSAVRPRGQEGIHKDREERLNLTIAENLRDPDDRPLGRERHEAQRSRRSERPPRPLLIIGIAPALAGEQLDDARQMLALQRDDLWT